MFPILGILITYVTVSIIINHGSTRVCKTEQMVALKSAVP